MSKSLDQYLKEAPMRDKITKNPTVQFYKCVSCDWVGEKHEAATKLDGNATGLYCPECNDTLTKHVEIQSVSVAFSTKDKPQTVEETW